MLGQQLMKKFSRERPNRRCFEKANGQGREDSPVHLVGLLGELPPKGLVVLLLLELVLQGVVPLGHQGLHLVPLALHILAWREDDATI